MLLSLITSGLIQACDSFLDVDPPENSVLSELVFSDDVSANSAMAGVYIHLYDGNSFASGSQYSVTMLAGLSADELHNVLGQDVQWTSFEYNVLLATNQNILSLWKSMYKSIYEANAMLEGLQKSSDVTTATKNQLRGEALFVRAFCYLYLVNCFGDVPLALTTNYRENNSLSRTDIEIVNAQVESDLLEAENLLNESYVTTGRVRPNRFTATAMLARFYLYAHDWQRAEDKATNVINKTSYYELPSNLNTVFLNTSTEAIWQLKPLGNVSTTGTAVTYEGMAFGSIQALQQNQNSIVLNDTIIYAFEPGDKRWTNWVSTISIDGEPAYIPSKYKLQTSSSTTESNECSMVLRLAEQHLIRAEARAMQDKYTGANSAESDINIIRSRAGLTPITVLNEDQALEAIDRERRLELLTEWAHRWFDLKRRGKATKVLAPVKPAWTPDDELYPLPAQELTRNVNLQPQNPNY